VTGGVGGVHRGGESSWDVSADLTELRTTPMVCAGSLPLTRVTGSGLSRVRRIVLDGRWWCAPASSRSWTSAARWSTSRLRWPKGAEHNLLHSRRMQLCTHHEHHPAGRVHCGVRQGVPVVAYSTDEFPAFFTPKSGLKAPARLDTPQEVIAGGTLPHSWRATFRPPEQGPSFGLARPKLGVIFLRFVFA